MPTAPAGPRRRRARLGALRVLLAPIRLVLVAVLLALSRGLGGRPYVPTPDRRNLPADVERTR